MRQTAYCEIHPQIGIYRIVYSEGNAKNVLDIANIS